MSKVYLLNLLACFVGLISIITCFSFIFQNRTLFTAGQSTGFSPMPLPFRELVEGSDNINVLFSIVATRGKFEREYSQNELVELLLLHKRPHRAAIPFYAVSNYFPVIPSSIKKGVYLNVCNKMNVDTILVHLKYEKRKYDYTVICKK